MRLVRLWRRLEFQTLASLIGLGAALWAFLSISDEVTERETQGFDRAVILALRTPGDVDNPIGPRWLEEAMRDVTALGGFTFLTLFVIIAAAALAFYRRRRSAVVLVATVVLAEVCNDLLKLVYSRPRPDLVAHGSWVYTHSFPSGHSLLSATVFLTTAAIISSLEPRRSAKAFVFGLAIALIVAIGFSRVYLGVHWPTDVLAGWTLGAAWALVARVALGLWRHGEGPPEVDAPRP